MPAPAITLQCHLQDMFGNVNQGSILFMLLNLADRSAPRVSGTSVLATQFEISSDQNGLVSTTIYGNDVITPGPNQTIYCLVFKDAQGGIMASALYQLVGSGTQDLSQLQPFILPPFPFVLPPNPVLQNPTGLQTITSFPLITDLAGVNVVIPVNGTPVIDLSIPGVVRVTLNQNISPTFINLIDGLQVLIEWIQDATGGRTVTFPGNTANLESPDGTANRATCQFCSVIGTTLKPMAAAVLN